MHFLKFPVPLWFLAAGAGTEIQKSVALDAFVTASVAETSVAFTVESGSTIPFAISAAYNISLSVTDYNDIQIELSGFTYGLSVTQTRSQQAFLSADLDGPLDQLNVFVTVTPVYVLNQAGQFNKSVEAAYNLTGSAAAGSLAAFLSHSAAFNISVSNSAATLISDQFSAAVSYNITASADIIVSKTQPQVSVNPELAGMLSAIMSPTILVNRGGGLVWGRRKKKRFPIKVGHPF